MQLNQKENALLDDMIESEKLCIEKYKKHSGAAIDGQLKGLFSNLSDLETKHLDSLNTIKSGTVPTVQGGAQQAAVPTFQQVYSPAPSQDKSTDMFLCTDALSGEKYVSHLYDTGIFEFRDDGIRNVLNHIQKEEQQHGKMIYNYMSANSMYC